MSCLSRSCSRCWRMARACSQYLAAELLPCWRGNWLQRLWFPFWLWQYLDRFCQRFGLTYGVGFKAADQTVYLCIQILPHMRLQSDEKSKGYWVQKNDNRSTLWNNSWLTSTSGGRDDVQLYVQLTISKIQVVQLGSTVQHFNSSHLPGGSLWAF